MTSTFAIPPEDPRRELDETLERWQRLGWPAPAALVVAGSGLAVDLGEPAAGPAPLGELLPFPVSALQGHSHSAEVLLPRPDRPVLYLRGRVHAYQGYGAHQVVLPVRLAARLGARLLVMTNAAGGLNPDYRPGDLVMIRDHLNLTGLNPLRGEPPPEWGPRFPDMVDAYDPALRRRLAAHGDRLGLALAEGVYAGLAGPSYETPAEVRMLRLLGADLGGMSTVLEVIAARHMGLACLGMSLVSNLAAGVSGEPLSHQEVLAAGAEAGERVAALLTALLEDPELL